MTDTAPLLGGRFALEERLAEGGMGEVWRARDQVTGLDVAVKLLAVAGKHARERFDREAILLRDLRIDGVIDYVGHGFDGKTPWLAMQWLDGLDLDRALGERAFSVDEVLTLGIRVGRILADAHAHGVVHRDLKPGNLLLPGGEVARATLLDFGIARRLEDAYLTKPGSMVGTPGYMAPEQVRGALEIDHRADLFALGAVLYECLTNRPAFDGDKAMAILTKVVFGEPRPIIETRRDVPLELAALIEELLAKDPADRPESAASVVERLGALQEDGAGASRITEPEPVTSLELRWVSLVVAPPGARDAHLDAQALAEAMPADVARLEALRDGSVAVLVTTATSPVAQVRCAARVALWMREVLPEVPLSVAAGRAVVGVGLPVGDVIDRAVAGLDGTEPGRVRLDEASARWLRARFELEEAGGATYLRTERARPEAQAGGPCLGREAELEAVREAWIAAVGAAEGSAVLLSAAAGMGKTRLLEEIAARVPSGARVWFAAADRPSRDRPLSLLALLLHAAGFERSCSARERLDPVSQAFLREAMGDVMDTGTDARAPDGDGAIPEVVAARADPPLMEARVRTAVGRWLDAEATAGPVLLCVDDVQWADAASLSALTRGLAQIAHPALLVLAGREEAQARLGEAGVEVARAITLAPLPREAAEQLVRARLGDLDDDAVETLLRVAGGHALFLEQLTLGARRREDGSLPDSVLGTIEARLSALGERARRVLRAASVLGRHFEREALVELLGGVTARDGLARALTELIDEDILVAERGGSLAFRHDLLREAAYAMLTEPDRVRAHAHAAEWLSEHTDADPIVLAEHFERAGQPRRAVPPLLLAARRALDGHDLGAAERLVSRALEAEPIGEERGRAYLLLAEVQRFSSRRPEAAVNLRAALALLPDGCAGRFDALALLGSVLGPLGETAELLAWASELEAARPATAPATAWAMAACSLGLHLTGLGRYAEADHLLDPAREVWAEVDDARLGETLHNALGFRAVHASAFADAVRDYRTAMTLAASLGDAMVECKVASSLGYVECELGLLERAEATLARAVGVASELGLEETRLALLHNLGHVHARLGRHDLAIDVERLAADGLAALGHTRLASGSWLYLAESCLALDDLDGAERALDRAEDLAAAFGPMLAIAEARRAELHLRRGEHEVALRTVQRAVARLDEVGGIEEGEATVRRIHAEALLAAGHADEARAIARALRDSVLARASRLDDPALARSFLERNEDNALVLALHARLDGGTDVERGVTDVDLNET